MDQFFRSTVNEEMCEMKKKSKESLDLGNGNGDVELFEISMKFGDYDRLIGLSKMNGKKMYVVLETVSKDKTALDGLRITRAVLR